MKDIFGPRIRYSRHKQHCFDVLFLVYRNGKFELDLYKTCDPRTDYISELGFKDPMLNKRIKKQVAEMFNETNRRPTMDKQAIKEICLKHGYKLKPQADGTQDLNAYVYDAFDEVLIQIKHGQEMMNLAQAAKLSDALHLIECGIRYNHDKDLEQGLNLLRSIRNELTRVRNEIN